MPNLRSRKAAETLARELARLSPEITTSIARMRRVAYRTGQVPGKYKLLTAAAMSVVIRCEPCIRAYVEWAAREGATRQELVEFLNVAMTMQGCPGEEWALKALRAFDELGADPVAGSGEPEAEVAEPGSEGAGAETCCLVPPGGRPEPT